jgi:hypothetical protein
MRIPKKLIKRKKTLINVNMYQVDQDEDYRGADKSLARPGRK